MPLQRRLPKRGFVSLTKKDAAEVRLSTLDKLSADTIDILVLKQVGAISRSVSKVKIILSGEIGRAIKLQGIAATKGAKAAIESIGGSIE